MNRDEQARLHREASTPKDIAALLRARGLDTEAKLIDSVAHVCREAAFNTVMGCAEQRAIEAGDNERGAVDVAQRKPDVARDMAERAQTLRRRERALRWAAEAILRGGGPEPSRPSPTAEVMRRVNSLAGPSTETGEAERIRKRVDARERVGYPPTNRLKRRAHHTKIR